MSDLQLLTQDECMQMLSPYQRAKYKMDFTTCLLKCPDCGEWCFSLEECVAYQMIKLTAKLGESAIEPH
jgi:hypothetical protein